MRKYNGVKTELDDGSSQGCQEVSFYGFESVVPTYNGVQSNG